MNDVLAKVRTLKERAKARTASADRKKQTTGSIDYSASIVLLDEAISILLGEFQKIEGPGANDAYADDITPTELASELADCYGMLGGVYRRAEDLDKSVEQYDEGNRYETSDTFGVQNSYNLTNSIVIRILRDPQALASQKEKMGEAIRFVENQVEGPRKGQWWAWSDLGELRLLDGRIDDALTAYGQFKEKGARARDFESTISVLSELEKRIGDVDPNIARGFVESISFLKQNKPSS